MIIHNFRTTSEGDTMVLFESKNPALEEVSPRGFDVQ